VIWSAIALFAWLSLRQRSISMGIIKGWKFGRFRL